MTAERLAVYSTWYPAVAKYVPEWAASLRAQTDRDFDLWIGVDGMDAESLWDSLPDFGHPVRFVSGGGTPAEVRARVISQIVEEYPAVVFVDSDDLLCTSRVAAAREALASRDVDACSLGIIDESGRELGLRFEAPESAAWDDLLPRYNVFGLSNSAYRSEVLRLCLPIPDECLLIDWLLVTRAWAQGARLGFDRTARMAYRQYTDNIARVLPPFAPQDVLRATERVLTHYRCVLTAEGPGLPLDRRRPIEAARDRARRFHDSVSRSSARLGAYVEALNALTPQYVWWWAVAHPDLETIWKH
jgi:hypothetical protein